MFRIGYIHSPRMDLVYFLLLPFAAIGFAFFAQSFLSAVALLSISVWLTYPHHAATFVRTFGLKEDMALYKERLIVGPIVIMGLGYLGLSYAPITYFLIIQAWAIQHSIMQQHGFARIYDFKAKAGNSNTGKWDLGLNWILYLNLFVTSPLFTSYWVRELYLYNVNVSVGTVSIIQSISWGIVFLYACCYVYHVTKSVQSGNALNPIKYCFLGSSYFLWYFLAWQTDNVFVFGIGDRIMHSVQYIVMVYFYLDRKAQDDEIQETGIKRLLSFGHVTAYLALLLIYTLIYQVVRGDPFFEFTFGIDFLAFMEPYKQAIPEHGISEMNDKTAMALVIFIFVETIASIHYYYDSFIWKVSSRKTQKGL